MIMRIPPPLATKNHQSIPPIRGKLILSGLLLFVLGCSAKFVASHLGGGVHYNSEGFKLTPSINQPG